MQIHRKEPIIKKRITEFKRASREDIHYLKQKGTYTEKPTPKPKSQVVREGLDALFNLAVNAGKKINTARTEAQKSGRFSQESRDAANKNLERRLKMF